MCSHPSSISPFSAGCPLCQCCPGSHEKNGGVCGQSNMAELLTAGCFAFPQVHCISTEFTMRKHGGEKGVPFRVQIDTFKENENGEYTEHLHSASCQIKVFKVPRPIGGLSLLGNKLGVSLNSCCSPSEHHKCRTAAEIACKRASRSFWSCVAAHSLVPLCQLSSDAVEATKPVSQEQYRGRTWVVLPPSETSHVLSLISLGDPPRSFGVCLNSLLYYYLLLMVRLHLMVHLHPASPAAQVSGPCCQ